VITQTDWAKPVGSFRRSFQPPAHLTGEAVSASYNAGVLTVRVAGAYAGT
jgi:HSP20 family protein